MRVRDVSVRIERVLSIPHGAKLLIDEPPGEDLVVWATGDQTDEDIADVVDRYLFSKRRLPLSRWPQDSRQFAS